MRGHGFREAGMVPHHQHRRRAVDRAGAAKRGVRGLMGVRREALFLEDGMRRVHAGGRLPERVEHPSGIPRDGHQVGRCRRGKDRRGLYGRAPARPEGAGAVELLPQRYRMGAVRVPEGAQGDEGPAVGSVLQRAPRAARPRPEGIGIRDSASHGR